MKKTYTGRMQFKADSDETGQVVAEFATLNVIDHDRDVTLPGAFRDGQEVIIEAWNHNYGELPVGKGFIRERKEKAEFQGRFFLDTQGGQEHYKVAKAMGDLMEWSYTFQIEKSHQGQFDEEDVQFLEALDVWGVAPVQRGAGIGTRTTSIKTGDDGAKAALPRHSTPTTDAAWDGPANEARARSDEDAAYYRRIYAWRDPDGDPGVKSTYRFIHHMVDGEGNPGAANMRACQTGIGVLNGGRGGTTIPEGDRQGVWNHLAGHLRDADLEPPELKAFSALPSKDGDGGEDTAGEGEGQTGEGGDPSDTDLQARINVCEMSIIMQEARS